MKCNFHSGVEAHTTYCSVLQTPEPHMSLIRLLGNKLGNAGLLTAGYSSLFLDSLHCCVVPHVLILYCLLHKTDH